MSWKWISQCGPVFVYGRFSGPRPRIGTIRTPSNNAAITQ